MKKTRALAYSLLFVVALLVLAEVFLRLLGLGAPKEDPFLDISGDLRLYENRGGQMQTRPDRARLFRTESFEAKKPAGTGRIFCLGGSTVYGFPYEASAAWPALLQAGLNADGGKKWRVINSGGIAYASYRVMKIAKKALEYDPDALVVMSGHNEFLEKRVYAETLAIPQALKKTRTIMGRLRMFNLLKNAITGAENNEKALLGQNIDWDFVPRDEKQKEITAKHFRFSLENIRQAAIEKGVPVIFVTLPCNLKDYPPLGGDDGDKAHASYNKGLELLERNDLAGAYRSFRRAADWDAHPVRAFSMYNDMIREISSYGGAGLADVEKAFIEASGGIPGDDLFLDHVHFRSPGAVLAAEETIKALVGMGLVTEEELSSMQKGVEKAGESITPRQEAKALYGAAYESYGHMGKPERSKRLLNEALRVYPDFPEARRLLQQVSFSRP